MSGKYRDSIKIGLMGLGTVGCGVADILYKKAEAIARQVGCSLQIKRLLVRDPNKTRPIQLDPNLLTTEANDIIDDPEIEIIIEVLGGEFPAVDYIRRSIAQGKHVVTANKEVIAKHGPELLQLAQQAKVDILYEASVGGGIPLIAPFKRSLLANEISSIHAIINGTTNYILTRMAREGTDFRVALKQAQELGYAEPDPTNDIEGIDAAYKLAILATLAFHVPVRPHDVYSEGVSRLAPRDFRYAKELGYEIKLLAIAKNKDSTIQVRVHPAFVPEDLILAKVDGVFNAILVDGDLVGKVLFYGRGAGSMPTSSAIISDTIDLAQDIYLGVSDRPRLWLDTVKTIQNMSEITTRYYMRMNVADRPGVLAQIAKTLGDNKISIASVIQKETDEKAGTAEIVIMTHPALESSVREALKEVERLDVVQEIGNFVRVED